MESREIARYFAFGYIFRFLRDVQAGTVVHGDFLTAVDGVLKMIEELKLVVTKRAADGLAKFQKDMREKPADHKLTDEEQGRLRDTTGALENTLVAELGGHVAYIVTDKRIDVNKLLSDIPGLMAPKVFDRLPDIAKFDFMEAGKSIAFERPTAGAFHLLRGTEAVLRHLYLHLVRRNRSDLLWGPIVTSLRSRKKGRLPDVLLNNLDNIRHSFRNPTQHPEKMYDIQEVQDLFSLCVDAVNRMASYMPS